MSGTESKEREALKQAYTGLEGKPTSSWLAKVANMGDRQVIAVYMRLKNTGKI
jgi:predicted secreted protein